MNFKRDWTLILPIAGTFGSVANSVANDYAVKYAKEFAWNSPFWSTVYTMVLIAGLSGAVIVSFWRRDYRNYFIAMLCSFAAFILGILEQGIGAMWLKLLDGGVPFGIGYGVLLATAALMMGGFFYLHYTVIVLPGRVRNMEKTTSLRMSWYT